MCTRNVLLHVIFVKFHDKMLLEIKRWFRHYSVRYEHYYEVGKVAVLTTERIGECKPTELRTPS